MFRVLVCSLAALTFSSVTAFSQSSSGSGGELYIGIHGGYAEQGIGGVFQRFANPDHPDELPFGISALDDKGSAFGFHAGYDLPLDGLLPSGMFVGVVGEYSKANIGEERIIENLSGKGKLARTFTVENDLDWIASARARVGYRSGPIAVFGTLGWSWTDYEFRAASSCANATASTCGSKKWVDQPRSDSASVTADRSGLAFGGGVIVAMSDSLRLTFEYVHHDVGGSATIDQLAPHGAEQGKDVTIVDFDAIDVVQAKLSFKLN
jgi:opacity protein-like surface antigen